MKIARPLIFLLVLFSFLPLAAPGFVMARNESITAPAQEHYNSIGVGAIELQAFDLLSPDVGWLLVGQRLYWTKTGGQTWQNITPPGLEQMTIHAATFLDAKHGWVVATNAAKDRQIAYVLARTLDGGNIWQTVPLSLFEPGDESSFADVVYLRFLDAQIGWLVVKQATSSNFSVGALFKTADGGNTWKKLTIPIGEPVYFTTSQTGWTAGGAAGDELYRTQDGGQTWQPQTVDHLSADDRNQKLYQLPLFENLRAGTLPVIVHDGDKTRIEFYVTEDAGQSWHPETSVPVDQSTTSGTPIPLTVLGNGQMVMIAPNSNRIVKVSGRGQVATVISHDRKTAGIVELDMATLEIGWAKYMAGSCVPSQASDAQDALHCALETSLLHTGDGGQSWTVLDLPLPGSNLNRDRITVELPHSRNGESVSQPQGIGSQTQVFEGQGFDKCEIASANQLQNWIANSPYQVVNLYIGGSARACGNGALTASLVSQLSQQGWKFIPTWVGPQAPCYAHPAPKISYDVTAAYSEGVNEADAAIDTAASLGLTLADQSGTIIYYDLENYSTGDAACREAVKSFVSGWSERLRERGNQAGVYSNGPPLSTFAVISNAPDAIWPAHWIYSAYNPNATIWNVYGLSNDLWNSHLRIRQYAGGHAETWGGVAMTIDCNVVDGIVANITGDSVPPVTTYSLAGTMGAGGWYISAVQVTLSASDNSGGSGVRLIQYKIDAGNWQTYSGSPFIVLGDGNRTVYYQAQDNAGNWEAEKQVSFKVDLQAPSPPTSVSPGCPALNNAWQNACNDLNFAWSGARDGSGSGVKDYHYYWGVLADGALDTYTSNNGFDPPAVPGPVAVRYLRLAARDNVNHESQATTVFVLRYDTASPTTTLKINNGSATTNQVDVLLNLAASDAGSGVAEVRISNNGLDWTDWRPYADAIAWTLPALNRRTLPIYIQVRDWAGNESAIASCSIYLDLYPPMPHSTNYRICTYVVNVGGSAGITSTDYSLVSTIGQPWGTGANDKTSDDFVGRTGFLSAITGCLPISFTAASDYTMTQWVVASGGNLRGSTNYRLGDTAGQPEASGGKSLTSTNYSLSSGFWAQITGAVPPAPIVTPVPPIMCTPPPCRPGEIYYCPGNCPGGCGTICVTPTPTATPQPSDFGISINDGASYTNNPLVTVRMWAPNVTHMRLSNDSGYSDEGWQTYQVATTWAISTCGDYLPPRYIYAWFRDVVGNVYGPYSDNIIYDPVAPQGRVSVLGGATVTVTLWLEAWDDNSGVDEMRVGNMQAITTIWLPYTNTVEWVLTGDVVYVQFQDRAGNESPVYGSDGSVHYPNEKRIYLPLVMRNG